MLVAFCLFKYFPYGGLQRDFLRIAKTVESRGHQVRVYVQSWEGDKPDSFEIIFVPTPALTNHGQGRQFADWVHAHLAKHPADVLVGFNKMPGLDVYYAADVCYKLKVDSSKQGLKGLLYRLTPRYRHFSHFEEETYGRGRKTRLMMIAQSQITDFTKYYNTEPERFVLLPPGIAPDRRYSNRPAGLGERFRRENGIAPDALMLLQVGSDFARKGVDRSIRAIAALPQDVRRRVVYITVGQDAPEKFQALAGELGVKDNVRILAGRSDVPDMLAAADVFLHPAYSENTGTVILEAVAAGVPLIVTACCGYAFHVEKSGAGLVVDEPDLQGNLNRALARLLTDDSFRAQCAANARRYADTEDLYSMPEKAADVILSLT